jgi:hypothetical protein
MSKAQKKIAEKYYKSPRMENYEDQNKVVMGYNPTYEIIMSSY